MVEYKKEIRISQSKDQGYLVFYDIGHPLHKQNGMVYLHRHIASMKNGHWLSKDEHVHHIDGDKLNNDPENLMVVSRSEHGKLTAIERFGETQTTYCKICGKEIEENNSQLCDYCYHLTTRLFNPTKEELEKLVWKMPTTKVAKIYGVSDKAIDKRCRIFGISKPKRGYWRKLETGKL